MGVIDIAWSTVKLRKLCSDERSGQKQWGPAWAALKRRLASLDAADCLAAMANVPGRCHQLRGDRAGQFALHVLGPLRLVIVPDHDPVPALADGSPDLAHITKVRILEVVDYHGE